MRNQMVRWSSHVNSIPPLHLWPQLLQVRRKPAAKPDLEVLIAARIGMFHVSNGLHGAEVFAVAGAVAAQDDHHLAGIVTRSPIPVGLVITDGLGQAELRS